MGKLCFVNMVGVLDKVKAVKSTKDMIEVHSLLDSTLAYSFSQSRLHKARGDIANLLSQLSDDMTQTTSGGSTIQRWIMARYAWDGTVWTSSLNDVDMLLAMGRGANQVKIIEPQGEAACCDMPYAVIAKIDAMNTERLLPENMQIERLAYWNYGDLRKED